MSGLCQNSAYRAARCIGYLNRLHAKPIETTGAMRLRHKERPLQDAEHNPPEARHRVRGYRTPDSRRSLVRWPQPGRSSQSGQRRGTGNAPVYGLLTKEPLVSGFHVSEYPASGFRSRLIIESVGTYPNPTFRRAARSARRRAAQDVRGPGAGGWPRAPSPASRRRCPSWCPTP